MPTHKDLKRLVRRRMQKTGESYTAARAQLLEKRSPNGTTATAVRPPRAATKPADAKPPAASVTAKDYAKLAGMSDQALEAATGCNWDRWVKALDYVQAQSWPHRKIADYVYEKFEITGWWAQTVTVGYERIRGLREIGQRRGGSFEASKSRTFAVPVAKLYAAFATSRKLARWVPGVKLAVRKATPDKSVRISWDDGTSVEVWLTAKGAGKSAVAVTHSKLPDKAAAARMKTYWDERLDALEHVLNGSLKKS
jgi:uncharacterized protein YndB with AHSA1/START domain